MLIESRLDFVKLEITVFVQRKRKMLILVGRQTATQVRYSSGKLKELGIRLKSIRNIEKITKTMKMISSAKFAKVFFFIF